MRIAIVVSNYSLGGAEAHALKLAKYFKNEKNFEVEYWVFSYGDGVTKLICEENNIPTRELTEFRSFKKFPKSIRDIGHYVKFVRQFKPNVVMSFNVLPNIWNGVISNFSGVNMGGIFHDSPFLGRTDKYISSVPSGIDWPTGMASPQNP